MSADISPPGREDGGEDGARVVEESLDHYAQLVRRLLRTPTALVTVIGTHHQMFPGVVGLPEPYQSERRTPLTHSYCQYVVKDSQPLIASDVRTVPRLKDSLAIRDLNVVAYAGWPLTAEDGRTIGSLCAIDSERRAWTTEEIGFLEDIAVACSVDLRRTRRVVADSENLARTIFASANVAMAFYDTRGRLVLANRLAERAAELAGFRLDEPPYAGPHVRLADNQAPVPPEAQVIPRALRGDLIDHEMGWFGPLGNQVALIASSRQVHRADGTPWGTLLVAHDVTELARALQVKDDIITTISHELRTPLTSVLGYLEVLADQLEEREEPVARTLETIERGAVRLQTRVAELIDAADRRRQLDRRSTDVNQLVHQVSSPYAEQAQAAGIQLSVGDAGPQWAVVDSRRIEQAVENLVTNALKFTESGGRVSVTVESHDETVEIVVVDDGVGMSADEVAQAFDLFWRADDVHRAAVPGMGIGLTSVREILDAHQGSVEIASRPGEGTTVRIALPRDAAAG